MKTPTALTGVAPDQDVSRESGNLLTVEHGVSKGALGLGALADQGLYVYGTGRYGVLQTVLRIAVEVEPDKKDIKDLPRVQIKVGSTTLRTYLAEPFRDIHLDRV